MNPPAQPNPDDTAAAEERRLRELFGRATPDYIDDAGFTARVIGCLPASRRRRSQRRLVLVGMAALLGGGLAAVGAGPALPGLGATGWALLADWCARPVPALESVLNAGSLVVLVGGLGLGWWAYAQD